MKIVEGWTGTRSVWIAIESAAEGKERDVMFATETEAVAYRNAVNAARRGGSVEEVNKLRAKAVGTDGYLRRRCAMTATRDLVPGWRTLPAPAPRAKLRRLRLPRLREAIRQDEQMGARSFFS